MDKESLLLYWIPMYHWIDNKIRMVRINPCYGVALSFIAQQYDERIGYENVIGSSDEGYSRDLSSFT